MVKYLYDKIPDLIIGFFEIAYKVIVTIANKMRQEAEELDQILIQLKKVE